MKKVFIIVLAIFIFSLTIQAKDKEQPTTQEVQQAPEKTFTEVQMLALKVQMLAERYDKLISQAQATKLEYEASAQAYKQAVQAEKDKAKPEEKK
jgi:hypothetical protein